MYITCIDVAGCDAKLLAKFNMPEFCIINLISDAWKFVSQNLWKIKIL